MAAEDKGSGLMATDEIRHMYVAAQAARLFTEKGYAQTKVVEIAAAAHMSGETLYRLFPGKLAVLAAAIETCRDGWFRAPIAEDTPVAAALEAAFRVDLDPLTVDHRMAFLRCVISESLRNPEVEAVFRGYCTDGIRTALAAWLRRRDREGRIAVGNAEAAAQLLMSMVFGALTLGPAAAEPSHEAAERVASIRRCVAVFLHGVARDPG